MVGGGCALGMLSIIAAGAIGYILNIIKIFAGLSEPITGMFVGRVVGAFIVPIGCVAGWL